MTALYVIADHAADGTYIGAMPIVLTPSELIAWMLWKLGA